jgi:hypothetical protein
MGMRTIVQDIPKHLIHLIDNLRAKLRQSSFLDRHRVRPQDFTRDCQLTFTVVMLGVLQKTVKSIQRHLHEFLDELSAGELFEPVTSGAWTHARAKLKHSAFVELNRECLLPVIYGAERSIQRWRGHRLLGIDSSLLRLPNQAEVGEVFGWVEISNQGGATGTRYPEARISVVYDLLNRICLEARLEKGTLGEVALAIEQLSAAQTGDVLINDRGFSGYRYLAEVCQRGAHFISRCSRGSFRAAQDLFALNRANQSRVVWLFAPADQQAECKRAGLPLKMAVRFVSLRLPSGELEVLATSLLDEELYPTKEFLSVYHGRWEHETFHLMLKGRLDLENFTGLTVEAVRQDFHAAVLLCNLESVLTEPAQVLLSESGQAESLPLRVNRSVSYHALKEQLLELLYRDIPAAEVVSKLMQMFVGSPVTVRADRRVPRRRKPSFHRSYHYQRHLKKIVF